MTISNDLYHSNGVIHWIYNKSQNDMLLTQCKSVKIASVTPWIYNTCVISFGSMPYPVSGYANNMSLSVVFKITLFSDVLLD